MNASDIPGYNAIVGAMTPNPTAGTFLDPNSWAAHSCPDNAFLNSQTGQCETFAVGTPPPPLPMKLPWSWWQWAALAGAIGLAGLIAHEVYTSKKVFHTAEPDEELDT